MTLEPCPFCGGEAEWRDDPGVCDVPFGLVVAHKDHCFLNHIAFEEADIISAWNTRAPDPRIAALEAENARKDEALRKVMPIRVEDGPDYASVYFGDGSTHSTKAMTMNPQDWLDISAALEARND